MRVAGAKNSVLKLMAATLLAEGSYCLDNAPRIVDVELMAELLRSVGCTVAWDPARQAALRIDVPAEIEPVAPYDIVERFRASVVVLGPMLARCGQARVALPGGDDFGPRPIDMHVNGLIDMGASIEIAHGYIEASTPGLIGARLLLEFPSVGATENLLMAAVCAKGVTVIDNAAREPEIGDLCQFLTRMGARIDGIGSATLVVEGVGGEVGGRGGGGVGSHGAQGGGRGVGKGGAGSQGSQGRGRNRRQTQTTALHPADHRVLPDRIVAATYLAAAGIASGEVMVAGARHDHMTLLCQKLVEMGMIITPVDEGIRAISPRRLGSVDCSTLPYPGVSTDYKPFIVAMLATASGVGIVTENLFPGRFRYVDELRRMGANIRTDAHHAVVRGVKRLSGAPVRAHDIRAGAALAVAGLGAEGETVVSEAHHVARGYEDLAGDLAWLGADVRAE